MDRNKLPGLTKDSREFHFIGLKSVNVYGNQRAFEKRLPLNIRPRRGSLGFLCVHRGKEVASLGKFEASPFFGHRNTHMYLHGPIFSIPSSTQLFNVFHKTSRPIFTVNGPE